MEKLKQGVAISQSLCTHHQATSAVHSPGSWRGDGGLRILVLLASVGGTNFGLGIFSI